MKLRLINGYPYPFPQGASEAELERYAEEAPGNTLVLRGVKHFEWIHTVTVEFYNPLQLLEAVSATRWNIWGTGSPVLESPVSTEDGYNHPAIIAGDMAYCGFILEDA